MINDPDKKIYRLHYVLIVIFSLFIPVVSYADTIAIIGTGNVGSALGKNWAQRGHTIVYGSRDPGRDSVQELVRATGNNASITSQSQAVEGADIVVLAVPWEVTEDIVKGLGDLSGKIILDPTNPRDFNEAGDSVPPGLESNAEKIKRLAPGAHVAKAFNHMPASLMESPGAMGFEYSMSLAGDDRAVEWIETIAGDMGFKVAVLGGLRETRLQEAIFSTSINMRRRGYGYTVQFHEMPR